MLRLGTTPNAVLILLIAGQSAWAEQDATSELSWFDGTPHTFVVNGYSTSRLWPSILQRKLDKYFDGKRVIEVKSATAGGTPIAKWMNIETGEPRNAWLSKLRPLLKEKSGPTIVLAQQSLQWCFGDRNAGIQDAHDTEHIGQGAAAIKTYADLVLADGADALVIAMHIYKKPMEPEIGNERLALAEYLKSKPDGVFAGPDVWDPTSKVWPQAFREDKVHPNEMGAEIMAHHWFSALLALNGRKVPSWSTNEMIQAIANPPTTTPRNASRQPNSSNRGSMITRILRYDANNDGEVTKAEFKGPARIFEQYDKDSDGNLSKKELTPQGN